MTHDRVSVMAAILAAASLLPATVRAQAALGPSQQELERAHASTADWLHAAHDYAGRRFVALDQVTPANAHQLRPVCAYQGAMPRAFHTNPLVYRGVMYLTTRYETVALDAGTCRLRWKHDHDPERDRKSVV